MITDSDNEIFESTNDLNALVIENVFRQSYEESPDQHIFSVVEGKFRIVFDESVNPSFFQISLPIPRAYNNGQILSS